MGDTFLNRRANACIASIIAVAGTVFANSASAVGLHISDLDPYIGNRVCTTVTATGEPAVPLVRIDWAVKRGPNDRWLVGNGRIFDPADDLAVKETIEVLGIDARGEHYIRNIFAGDGVVARFSSPGWIGRSMVWMGTIDHPEHGALETQITVTFGVNGIVTPVYAFRDTDGAAWVDRIFERCESVEEE